jgi:putative transposase
MPYETVWEAGVIRSQAVLTAIGTPWEGQRQVVAVECVVSDDHAGLKNARDYLAKADDDCLQELRWIDDRRDLPEAQGDPSAWISKWQGKYPKLVGWVESTIGETLGFYRLPRAHHKHRKRTNLRQRRNEKITHRLQIACTFPNAEILSAVDSGAVRGPHES